MLFASPDPVEAPAGAMAPDRALPFDGDLGLHGRRGRANPRRCARGRLGSLPCVPDFGERRREGSGGSGRRSRARSPCPNPASGTRPATCRPRARAAGPAAGVAARCSRPAARLPVDAGQVGRRRARRSTAGTPCAAPGTHRPFSSRWFRQNARSKAGSPYQAHSASRNTGPCGPTRMFFGLTSPCTSASLVCAVRSDKLFQLLCERRDEPCRPRADRARGGWRGNSRRWRIPRRMSARRAVAAWMRGERCGRPPPRTPDRRGRARSSAFQSG